MSEKKDFTFRLKFARSPQGTLDEDCDKLVFHDPVSGQPIVLASSPKDVAIKKSEHLVLQSDGWPTARASETAGNRCGDALRLALVRLQIGADFGLRGHKSVVTEAGLQMLQEQSGHERVLNDEFGLTVFESNPPPRFVSVAMKAVKVRSKGLFEQVFEAALVNGVEISDRERLAIELFSASLFQEIEDTKFLLLVMAVEALLEPGDRSPNAALHVSELIHSTKTSESLSQSERDSLVGSLERLKKESINQTGRKLAAERLGSRKYDDIEAAPFFSHCYDIRSNMVHGRGNSELRKEVRSTVAMLENFVSDILSAPLELDKD